MDDGAHPLHIERKPRGAQRLRGQIVEEVRRAELGLAGARALHGVDAAGGDLAQRPNGRIGDQAALDGLLPLEGQLVPRRWTRAVSPSPPVLVPPKAGRLEEDLEALGGAVVLGRVCNLRTDDDKLQVAAFDALKEGALAVDAREVIPWEREASVLRGEGGKHLLATCFCFVLSVLLPRDFLGGMVDSLTTDV